MLVPATQISTHSQRVVTQFTRLLQLTRVVDGQVLAVTLFRRDLAYDDGGSRDLEVRDQKSEVRKDDNHGTEASEDG